MILKNPLAFMFLENMARMSIGVRYGIALYDGSAERELFNIPDTKYIVANIQCVKRYFLCN